MNELGIQTGMGEEIISLPVSGQTMQLRWNPELFSAIIPVSESSSLLVYDGLKLNVDITSEKFSELISKHENDRSELKRLEAKVKKSLLVGSACMAFHNEGGYDDLQYQLMEYKWDTSIISIKELKHDLTFKCESRIRVSYLLTCGGSHQATFHESFTLEHNLNANESIESMARLIDSKLEKKSRLIHVKVSNEKEFYTRRRSVLGDCYIIAGKGEGSPIFYLPVKRGFCSYGRAGASLNVEMSRFGNLTQLTSAQIQADATLKSAKLPYLLKMLKMRREANSLQNVADGIRDDSQKQGLALISTLRRWKLEPANSEILQTA